MRNVLLTLLVCASLSANAQYKKQDHSYKSGTGLIAVGCIAMSIGFLLPDGSEWTFAKGYNSQRIVKPFYKNPARVACIGIGLTLTIGGAAYNKTNR
jgi:hypothetical protein